jgi:hypothetical protein
MNVSQFGLLCLTAVLTTAIWAGLLYVGSLLFGIALEPVLFAQILGVIFVLMLFGLGIAASSGQGGNGGREDHERSNDGEV